MNNFCLLHFFNFLSNDILFIKFDTLTARKIIFKQHMKYVSVMFFYPPTKSEGYSFGVVRASVRPSVHSVRPSVRPSVRTFCLSGTISQYQSVRFDSFLVQMISTMDSRYTISLVKIDPLTLELLPLF